MTSNQLAQETSPYLLQHKDNPVHWQAWGPQALALAAERNKPILLSIGYAACHWCHVMAHESFENPEIARLLNEHFINIKVDREERPDLDAIYQTALAMLGQQGGWPLTMFLTPKGEPFWGGTYFPPAPRYGRPGFPDVLRSVAEAFQAQPDKVAQNVAALLDGLRRQAHGGAQAEHLDLSLDLLDNAARQLVQYVDAEHGGLNGAPKFPQPFLFEFLWRGWLRTGDEALREAVMLTLDNMCNGGIYDHLGGGFHRYSTDAEWLAPHFEKMLYDNAQLVELLTLVWQQTRSATYATRIHETIEWVLREMVAEHGMFAATLDADSEGEEGRFYVWSQDRIEALIDPKDVDLFKQAYDCRPGGNWEGKIILNRNKAQPYAGESFETMLADCRAVLWRERESRIRPGRDDKVLADWNGLMIAAMAHAGFVFGMPRWIDAARTAFAGVQARMSMGVRLGHSLRHGRLQHGAMIDDYANMARAALVLHQITGERGYLDQAEVWVDVADRHYWDSENGGYFMTADDARDVIVRTKPVMDAATPSGNGVMAKVLTALFLLTGEDDYRARAEAVIAAAANMFKSQFANMATLLVAYEMLTAPVQIAIIGDPEDDETRELLRCAAETGFPNGILSIVPPGTPLPDHHPAHGKTTVDGKAAAYVCNAMTCSPPATTDDELRRLLQPGYS